MIYGKMPIFLGQYDIELSEVMYYLYLPVRMMEKVAGCQYETSTDIRLPPNVECCRKLIDRTIEAARAPYKYVYLSARKGWATADNPLNRPGWHCDGFGTQDLNAVYWVEPGTRFASQVFEDISNDHIRSLHQFDEQVREDRVVTFPEKGLYMLDPSVVHSTPIIGSPGCMRQYIKISLSNARYNLENNSHNYLFDYAWPLHSRDVIRNDPARAQLDYVKSENI